MATTEERENLSQLNQGRQESTAKKTTATKEATTEPPNFVVVIFMLIVALIADVGGAIPIVGFLIAGLALGIIWLWRIFSHQTGPKKDPSFQLLAALGSKIIPFPIPTYTAFVLYSYTKDTELGKATIGKAEKLAKVT